MIRLLIPSRRVLISFYSLVSFTLCVLVGLAVIYGATTGSWKYSTTATVTPVRVLVANVPENAVRYSMFKTKHDLGVIEFDLKADFRYIFNWNVREIFVYLTAEYQTKNNKLSQVVIWDKILRRGDHALLDYKKVFPKYFFWDDGHGLRGNKNVTLTLSWNIIPYVGYVKYVRAGASCNVSFPDDYVPFRNAP